MPFILKYLDLFFFGGALLLLVWLFFKQRRALYAETGTRLLSTNLTSLGSKFGGILAALIIVIGGLL